MYGSFCKIYTKKQCNKLTQLESELKIWLKHIGSEIASCEDLLGSLKYAFTALVNLQNICKKGSGKLDKNDSIILKKFFSNDGFWEHKNRNWLDDSVKVTEPKPIKNGDDDTNRVLMSIFGILTDSYTGKKGYAERYIKALSEKKKQN